MAVIWTGKQKPNLAGFPPGARAQRRGDGSWQVVVDSPASGPAPSGAPGVRFDTRGEVNDVNPGVALPGTAAGNAKLIPPAASAQAPAGGGGGGGSGPAPGAPAFDPLTEPIYGPALQSILAQQRGLPDIFNPQRQRLADNTLQGLIGGGFRENGTVEQASSTVGKDATGADLQSPDVTYRYVVGPEGRVYRQAYMRVATGYSGRGAYYSAGQQRDQGLAHQSLANQELQTQRNFDSAQSGLTGQEQQQAAGFGNQYQSTLSDQGKYRATQAANAVDPQQTGQQAAANAGVGPQAAAKPITVPKAPDTSPLPGVQAPMPGDRRAFGGPQPSAAAPGPMRPRQQSGPAYVDWRRLGVKPGTRR